MYVSASFQIWTTYYLAYSIFWEEVWKMRQVSWNIGWYVSMKTSLEINVLPSETGMDR